MKYIDAERLYKQVDELMARFAKLEKEAEPDTEDLSIFYQGKKKMCSELLGIIDSLQFLRPQSHKETYQAARHDLAIRFMNYLDENRPEGKMSLSNGECEDIDKAFKENDWTKIMQYAKKYLIQSEQQPAEWSEEDESYLQTVINEMEANKKEAREYEHKKYDAIILWLKSLRPQPKKELSIEKAIKWLDDTFCFLDNSSGRGRDCEITTHDFDSLEEMYDSFRKAVIVDSEPHWKPSEDEKSKTVKQ